MPTGIYVRTQYHKDITRCGVKKYFQNPEAREKTSKATKLAMNRPDVREKLIKIMNSIGVKERISRGNKIAQNRPEVKRLKSKSQTLTMNRPDIKAKCKEILNRPEVKERKANTLARHIADGSVKPHWLDTKIELKVFNYYINKGYKEGINIIKQYSVKCVGLVDFFLPKENTLIFVDGDYWHCNPTKYKMDYYHKYVKLTAQKMWHRDAIITKECIKQGYKVVRLWESDINSGVYEHVLSVNAFPTTILVSKGNDGSKVVIK